MRSSGLEFLLNVDPTTLPIALATAAGLFVMAYLIGSVPFAYLIVKGVIGEDVTEHGTGNVGAMNVKRTTGSWGWFAVAMLSDVLKGFLPTLLVVTLPALYLNVDVGATLSWSSSARVTPLLSAAILGPSAVALGCVVGHNYSLWLSIAKRRVLGGKGLATGAGALLAYDWHYFLIVVVAGLGVIVLTRYMMAGQVTAALVLPAYAVLTRQPDWLFTVVLGILVYLRHHRRFMGLLRGEEPRMYTEDRMGPRG